MIWIKSHGFLGLIGLALLVLAACGGSGAGGESGGGSGNKRTVEHAMGEAEIEGTPERIVVLDTGELDSVMTLGVTPVGAVESIAGAGFPAYLEGTDSGVHEY